MYDGCHVMPWPDLYEHRASVIYPHSCPVSLPLPQGGDIYVYLYQIYGKYRGRHFLHPMQSRYDGHLVYWVDHIEQREATVRRYVRAFCVRLMSMQL